MPRLGFRLITPEHKLLPIGQASLHDTVDYRGAGTLIIYFHRSIAPKNTVINMRTAADIVHTAAIASRGVATKGGIF